MLMVVMVLKIYQMKSSGREDVEAVFTFLGVLLTLVFFTFFTLDPLTLATFAPFLGVLPKFFMTTSDHSVAFFTDFGTFGVFPIVLGVFSPNAFFPPVLGVFNAGVARTFFLGLVFLTLGESSTSSLGVETLGVDPLMGVVTIGVIPLTAALLAVLGVSKSCLLPFGVDFFALALDGVETFAGVAALGVALAAGVPRSGVATLGVEGFGVATLGVVTFAGIAALAFAGVTTSTGALAGVPAFGVALAGVALAGVALDGVALAG